MRLDFVGDSSITYLIFDDVADNFRPDTRGLEFMTHCLDFAAMTGDFLLNCIVLSSFPRPTSPFDGREEAFVESDQAYRCTAFASSRLVFFTGPTSLPFPPRALQKVRLTSTVYGSAFCS